MPALPELVKDIQPGLLGSFPKNLTILGEKLFFTASGSGSGAELWVTDGTNAGTQLVKDIRPGSSDSDPQDLTVFNGKLFFTAKNGSATGRELWVSDGTAAGTQLLKDIYQGAPYILEDDNDPTGLTVFNGRLFFSANDGINGRELWVTDGTAVGTKLFKDINPGSNSSSSPFSSDPTNFIVFNGKLIFSALEASTSRELWISDGTAAGTQLLKDIARGSSSFFWGSGPENFTVLGNKLFFTATEWGFANSTGQELWVTDGTAAGTQLVKDINPGTYHSSARGLTVLNEKLFFSANDGTNGQELWVSDGTAAGTRLVKDIYPFVAPFSRSSDPQNLTVFNGKVFFSAEDGTNGRQVWFSDGTAAGTQLLKDLSPNYSGSYDPMEFTVFDGKLLISAGSGLWSSDGTTAGTQLVSNIFFDSSVYRPGNFTIMGDELLFTAGTLTNGSIAATGIELWKLDATTPSLTISPVNADKPEGNSGTTPFTFNVTRSGNISAASSVQYSVTGSGANPANAIDFGTTLPTGTVNFAANQTSAIITLNVKGDTAIESDESFTVTLRNATNATITNAAATGIIRNDDIAPTLGLVATSANKLEGNSGTTPFTFNVTRSGNISAASSVQYSVTGSGANPANAIDFGGALPTGIVNFAANQTTAIITLNVKGDTAIEPDENFTVTLRNATNATITNASATGIIRNDDRPTPQLSTGSSLAINNTIFASGGSINQTSLQTRSIDAGLQGVSQTKLFNIPSFQG